MADRAVTFREETLAASLVEFKDALPVCPKCFNQTLVLYGNMSFPHREIISQGQICESTTDWKFGSPLEVTGFECLHCLLRFAVQSDEVVQLTAEVLNLREELSRIKGTKQPC